MNLARRLEEAFCNSSVASAVLVIIEEKASMFLIERLDEVASKELHKNEFKNVTLILRALEQVIAKDEDCIDRLVHQGLVIKMLNWFELVCEHLKVQQRSIKAPVQLMEVFYEVSMRLCQSSAAVSSKILEILLLRFGAVVIDKEMIFNLRLEATKAINSMLDSASKETRKKLSMADHNSLLEEFAKVIVEIGDYEMQVAISEALCRMTPKKLREDLVGKWFNYRSFATAFTTIRVKEFETDCRIFLNALNSYFGDSRRVFSYPCNRAYLDSIEMFKPEDEQLQKFWVDFNIGSSCIGFYVNDPQETLWELIHLPKEAISGYNLREHDNEKTLSVALMLPVTHGQSSGKTVQIIFDSEYDIQTAVERVFSEEKSFPLLEALQHATVSDDDDSGIPATPIDLLLSTSYPVTETSERPQVSSDNSEPGKIPSLRGKKFQVEDTFAFTNDSDTEGTMSGRSHVRKKATGTFIAALWSYQVTRAKAVIFGQSHSSKGSVKSLPASVGQTEFTQKRKHKMFSSESDFSKDKPKFDYTRKRRLTAEFRVLPLSPPASKGDYFKESTPIHGREQERVGEGDKRWTAELSQPSILDSNFQDSTDDSVFNDAQPTEDPKLGQTPVTPLRKSLKSTGRSPAVMASDVSDADLSSAMAAALNTCKAQLQEHLSSMYKKTEEESLNFLTDCPQIVKSFLQSVHDQRLNFLDHIQDVVKQQLDHLEQNFRTLQTIEMEAVGFWQTESDSIRDFYKKLQKRLENVTAHIQTEMASQSQAGMFSGAPASSSTALADKNEAT